MRLCCWWAPLCVSSDVCTQPTLTTHTTSALPVSRCILVCVWDLSSTVGEVEDARLARELHASLQFIIEVLKLSRVRRKRAPPQHTVTPTVATVDAWGSTPLSRGSGDSTPTPVGMTSPDSGAKNTVSPGERGGAQAWVGLWVGCL